MRYQSRTIERIVAWSATAAEAAEPFRRAATGLITLLILMRGDAQFDNARGCIHNGVFDPSKQNCLNMPSIHHKTYKFSKRRASVLHVCLYWLLCVSVWRGPVPVVHEHALDLNSLANNCQLAEHAIVYHADCLGKNCLGHERTGLHVHFILMDHFPDSLTADSHSTGHHDIGAADTTLRTEQQHLAALELNAAKLQTIQSDLLYVAEDLRFSSTADASFLQTRLCSTSALAVLCVCLC